MAHVVAQETFDALAKLRLYLNRLRLAANLLRSVKMPGIHQESAPEMCTPVRGASTEEDNFTLRRRNGLLWISFFLFVAVYFATVCLAAASLPVWMDEVLSIWTMRQGGPLRILSALAKGAEFSPPAFHVLLHYYAAVVGQSYFLLRMLSLAGVLVTVALAFSVFRKCLDLPTAMFACCLLLQTLQPFAFQIRPYSLVTACFAVSAFAWLRLDQARQLWPSIVVGAALSFATGLHFYAVLFVPFFGVIELIRTRRTAEVRASMWIALVLAGASIFLWFPLLHAFTRYNAGDTSSPAYYARPTVEKLLQVYFMLSLGGQKLPIVVAANIVAAAGCIRRFRTSGKSDERASTAYDLSSLMWVFASLPVMIFVFSTVVTKTFDLRYTIAGAIGTSWVMASRLGIVPLFRRSVPLLLVFASLVMVISRPEFPRGPSAKPALAHLPGDCPIVVAEGLQFFPLLESSSAPTRPRLIYLTLPPGIVAEDATNEHQVQRWKAIDASLPVQSAVEFLRSHKDFFLIDSEYSDDTIARYLKSRHAITAIGEYGGVLIYKSRSGSEWK